MFAVTWAAAVIAVSAVSFEADGTTPAGTFSCNLLAAEKYDGGDGELTGSILGDITLDGKGGYTQGASSGTVAWADNALHFTSGAMSGTVAAVRQDGQGHRYLHIDSTVMNPPEGDPKFGDHLCMEK
ncbi:MAG: hypothetical protein GC190_13720 [Alphaproteobacteria bacterium]|nr:hypothetical protein [Alphaproteobacteria bacterium]